jgi:peptidoglycan/LPS O-acetylase OafA/YrhL
MKMSVKFNFIAGVFALLSGAAFSWLMYSSGGYKAEDAYVPLIIGMIGFLFILGIPMVLRALIKRVRESKLFLGFIIIHSVFFGVSQLYFDVGFVNGIILSLMVSLPALLLILIVSRAFGDKYQPIKPNGPLNMKAVRDFEKAVESANEKEKEKKKTPSVLTSNEYWYLSGNIHNPGDICK